MHYVFDLIIAEQESQRYEQLPYSTLIRNRIFNKCEIISISKIFFFGGGGWLTQRNLNIKVLNFL